MRRRPGRGRVHASSARAAATTTAPPLGGGGSGRRAGGGVARERGADLALLAGLREVILAVAERHAWLAKRHAAVGFPVDAAVDDHDLVARSDNLDVALRQDRAAAVERDQVGGAVS